MNFEHDEEYGLGVGEIDYITKPISKPIVMARIKNHLELKKHRDLLEKNSMMDTLTELPNRRKFEETIRIEWKQCVGLNAPRSIVMMDIDNFKNYNDIYGHLMGNEYLKKISAQLRKEIERTSNFIFRWGGEEFACLMPMVDEKNACIFCEQIRGS